MRLLKEGMLTTQVTKSLSGYCAVFLCLLSKYLRVKGNLANLRTQRNSGIITSQAVTTVWASPGRDLLSWSPYQWEEVELTPFPKGLKHLPFT